MGLLYAVVINTGEKSAGVVTEFLNSGFTSSLLLR